MKKKLAFWVFALMFVCQGLQAQGIKIEYFKDYPKLTNAEAETKLKQYSIDELNILIDRFQTKLEEDRSNGTLRHNLAVLLIRKVLYLSKSPYEELEKLFYEAESLLPSNFGIEATWGDVLLSKSMLEKALVHYENAIAYEPSSDSFNSNLYTKAAVTAANTMNYQKAAQYFSQITQMEPDNYSAQVGAGNSYYNLRSYYDALDHLEAAYSLAPTQQEKANIYRLLAQVKEYIASTDNSTTDEDQRFIVHFAGDSRDDIGDLTFDMLDDIYFQVTDSLNYDPDVKITVIFFLTEDYYKVAKDWSAGSAQGIQIMVPLKSGYKSQDYVRGLLAHEFTHTITHLKAKGRCPLWFDEGLAQFHEFQAERGSYEDIRADFLGILENDFIENHNFVSLNRAQQMIARGRSNEEIKKGYLASYLAVRCIADFYGEQTFDELLESLGEGKTMSEALEESTGRDLAEFEEEYYDWLRNF